MPGYSVSFHAVGHPAEIEDEWLELEARTDCSYFQSWGWIGTWLEQIAADLQPLLAKVFMDEMLVGMGIFVVRDIRRRYVFSSKAMFLHEYPFDGRNMVVEYNGLLADHDHLTGIYSEVLCRLFNSSNHCDEVFFAAVDETVQQTLLNIRDKECLKGFRTKLLDTSPAWWVDIEKAGEGVDGFLACLSKNRRAQIRRSLRHFQQEAPLRLHEATSTDEALHFLDELKILHTQRWQAAGQAGVFANPHWETFHRALVASRFARGEVQLLKVSDTRGPLGCLYNFIWREHVYVLQTGFRSSQDRQLMPGYVVHVMAIAHNQKKGMKIYDLMHGDSLYKRILCDHQQELSWMVVQRPRLRFVLEDLAVSAVRNLRSINPSGRKDRY